MPTPRLRSTALICILSAALAGCGDSASTAAGPSEWALDGSPVLAVGDTEDSDTAVFGRITDVRLLPNGALAVADGGASAVLLFDSTGAPLGKVGRRGRGPGEFAGQISLARLADDAVAVWDPPQSRWSAVRVDGTVQTGIADSLGDEAWAHAGAMVLGEGAVPAWVPPLLMALADTLPAMRLAFVDETSLLWVNRDADLREWVAYAGASAAGRVSLPPRFRPTQFRGDRVAGIQADSLGLERAVVYGFARPRGVASAAAAAAPVPADSGQRAALMAAMRNAVVAQEVFFMQNTRYASRADSLQLEMPPGTRLNVLAADARSWSGAGVLTATGFTCGMFIGVTPPRGWSEGEVRCAW